MKPVYFLSDLHAGSAHGDGDRRLIDFLYTLRGEAGALYLVGDVFDFWLGYRSAIFNSAFPLLRALSDVLDSGVPVTLFSGNHDPDPGLFLAGLGFTIQEGPLSIQLGEHRVWIEHGDVIDPRSLFQRGLCRFVRHPIPRWLARRLHPDTAWALGAWYGKKTEAYTEPLPDALKDRYFPERMAQGFDTVIIGHYHRAVRHELISKGRVNRFFVLGDWVSQCTYLRYDGEFKLMRHQLTGDPVELPEGDHGPSGLRP